MLREVFLSIVFVPLPYNPTEIFCDVPALLTGVFCALRVPDAGTRWHSGRYVPAHAALLGVPAREPVALCRDLHPSERSVHGRGRAGRTTQLTRPDRTRPGSV